jgi:hypothetical protein
MKGVAIPLHMVSDAIRSAAKCFVDDGIFVEVDGKLKKGREVSWEKQKPLKHKDPSIKKQVEELRKIR